MKPILLTIALLFAFSSAASAQLKEAAQLAMLSPSLLVVKSDIDNYKKMHYTMSTIGYLGSYMVTDSIWKSAVITLAVGVGKELVYDALFGRGEPLWEDMKWNALGTLQGVAFTVVIRF